MGTPWEEIRAKLGLDEQAVAAEREAMERELAAYRRAHPNEFEEHACVTLVRTYPGPAAAADRTGHPAADRPAAEPGHHGDHTARADDDAAAANPDPRDHDVDDLEQGS